MSVHSWSGTVACLLVLCLRAGCDASQQQQQQPAALSGVTADEFLSLISRAVQAELQPILSKLEARMEDLDRKLGARVEDLDRKLETRVEDLDRKLEAREDALESKLMLLDSRFGVLDKRMFILDKRVDELTVQLWNSTQQPQPNDISSRFDSQQVRMDEMSSKLDNQTSRLETLSTSQDSQASQLDGLQSQLVDITNITTAVQSRQDDLQSQLVAITNITTAVQSRQDGPQSQLVAITNSTTAVQSRAEDIDQPRDCSEMPPGTTSGVYPVWPDRSQDPVQAFCQEDSYGGNMWTVFQRRDGIQPRPHFYLGWDSYKRGFGNLTREFWWGLEHLHKLTAEADRPYQLRVDLEAFDGAKRHALYSTFRVWTEEDGYRLSYSGYSGTAGDGLRDSDSRRFSTMDRDNDGWSGVNCAEGHQGGWRYGLACGFSSLNGRYLKDGREDMTGIWWYVWRGTESLKKTQMMLRPS